MLLPILRLVYIEAMLVCDNAHVISMRYCLLYLPQQLGPFLFLSCCPRWPRQGRKVQYRGRYHAKLRQCKHGFTTLGTDEGEKNEFYIIVTGKWVGHKFSDTLLCCFSPFFPTNCFEIRTIKLCIPSRVFEQPCYHMLCSPAYVLSQPAK